MIARRQGRIGRITLNRPAALNALDLPMVHAIAAALDEWRDDPAVHAVVLDAAGGRAFCAGGDIRAIRQWVLDGRRDEIDAFFVHEYALDRAVARYPKPYISLIDGICMGGGIGLSVHGSIRVASERARFAMPECQLGLFPDVGASFFLPRLRGAFGRYLGLTGARVGGADSCWLGLATHFVPQAALPGLADAIAEHGPAALADFAERPPPGDLPALAGRVTEVFGKGSVPDIFAALEGGGAWEAETLAALRAASPSSLLWTSELLHAGARRTLEQCQRMELLLTRHATAQPDFIEGVRAAVIDKDRDPHWSPTPDPAAVTALFAEIAP